MSVCESEGKRTKLRMGRSPCCDKDNVKRGPWSPEEDAALKSYIHAHGTSGNWIHLPKKAGLRRCGKSCRLRWLNYLRPDIKHGGFTEEEDYLICSLYNQMGSRWSIIASHMPGRTDNDVKNYWNTKLKKNLFGGKINLASKTTKEPSQVLAFAPKSEPKDSAFSIFETQIPPTLQMITDVNSGLNAYNQALILNPDQFFSPKQNGFSELGANAKKSYSAAVSLSQDCSSTVSDSSSMPANGGAIEDSGIFMDFDSFGLPYEMANFDSGMFFGENASNSDPAICSTNFADIFFHLI